MKNNSGVTLMALIAYSVAFVLLIGIIASLTDNVYSFINRSDESQLSFSELNKAHMYILDETSEKDNKVSKISADNTQIEFTSGNVYTFKDNAIYKNQTKVVKDVANCTFEIENIKNQERLVVNIAAGQDVLAEKEYIYGIEEKVVVKEEVGLTEDGSWTGTVNAPKLLTGMEAVAWDDSNVETPTPPTTNEEWYEYKVQGATTTSGGTSEWANAKTTVDESYWVWIPRYEYKINDETSNPPISVNFIPTSQTEPTSGYTIHPAFTNGSANNYKNGGWDSELAGIWVMKFEASNNSDEPASKPGITSWRSISISDMYTHALNYDSDTLNNSSADSHLMKNSEWGAVAYLAQSQYGRGQTEVTINNSSSYITGSAGDTVSASSSATPNAWNTSKGVLASTTGNIYGVYDMSGGAYEYVAGYISNGNANLGTYGSSFANATANENGYETLSTKYVTVYPYDSSDSSDTSINNYTKYESLVTADYGKGDAILETSTAGIGATTWFSDYSYFAYSSVPFLLRGGGYNNTTASGIWCFTRNSGSVSAYYSFRVVMSS